MTPLAALLVRHLAEPLSAYDCGPTGSVPLALALEVLGYVAPVTRCPDCIYGAGSDHRRVACSRHRSVQGAGGRKAPSRSGRAPDAAPLGIARRLLPRQQETSGPRLLCDGDGRAISSRCAKCLVRKAAAEFYTVPAPSLLTSYCRLCKTAQVRANKAQVKARKAAQVAA